MQKSKSSALLVNRTESKEEVLKENTRKTRVQIALSVGLVLLSTAFVAAGFTAQQIFQRMSNHMLDMAILSNDDVIICLITVALIFIGSVSALNYAWNHS